MGGRVDEGQAGLGSGHRPDGSVPPAGRCVETLPRVVQLYSRYRYSTAPPPPPSRQRRSLRPDSLHAPALFPPSHSACPVHRARHTSLSGRVPRLRPMDLKAAVSRELRRRGVAVSDEEDEDNAQQLQESRPLLRASEPPRTREQRRARQQQAHLGPVRRWLQSTNNRSAACVLASAASGAGFSLAGYPDLAVKCCVGLALLSIFLGLPQSDEDQAEEDELLEQLHEDS